MDPTRWPLSSPFQSLASCQDTPPLPYGNTSWTQILYFPAPHNTQNKTQPSGLDNETDLIQRLSRKSEIALSELLMLPASSEVVLSAAP